MAKVVLSEIVKKYEKDIVAVRDFNCEIQDKEFVVLVGPSGCGKSTTLRMIAGLEDISSGELYIGDKLVNHIAPKDRDIAMVFQNYALYPHMTVYDNMAFALKLRKMKKEVIQKRVKNAAQILDITEYLNRKPRALSGGQRQRVAIGRAIVREPQVFLMDEPLSNLDAKLRNQMRAELIRLHKRLQTTFVYVTHDQTEALTLGDRIVIMNDGLIQQIGTPKEVFGRPANQFVAGFIGTPQMNFFEDAKLISDQNQYYVEVMGKRFLLHEEYQQKLKQANAQDTSVVVGVRPEHIQVAAEGTQQEISADVNVSEMMGSEILLHTNAQSNKDIVVRIQNVESLDDVENGLQEKGTVRLRLSEKQMHVFDKETGANLLND